MTNTKGKIIVYFIIATISISTVLLTGYIFYDKSRIKEGELESPPTAKKDEKKDNENNSEDRNDYKSKYVSKLDESKDWIYDAEYTKRVISEYYSTNYGTFYAKDIIVPFINIDSSDAKIANSEIETTFNNAVNKYNQGARYKEKVNYKCSYEKYVDENILSTILEYGDDFAYPDDSQYFTYNIDLKTGNKLSYEEIYKIAEFESNNINTKVEEAITTKMKTILTTDSRSFNDHVNKSITNYKIAIEDNTLKYFLSEDKKLNIIVRLDVPSKTGYTDKIIEIN